MPATTRPAVRTARIRERRRIGAPFCSNDGVDSLDKGWRTCQGQCVNILPRSDLMPDAVGYRMKFGVIVPSTNTVVEADYNQMAPHGVTFHTGRMYIGQPVMDSDAAFEAVLQEIRASITTAIRDVMTCKPDYMIMGMSSEAWGGGVD